MNDEINHPSHYTYGSIEVIDVIEGLGFGYHAGNIVKYVARYKHKGGVQDLKKARWYLDRLIANEEAQAPSMPTTVRSRRPICGLRFRKTAPDAAGAESDAMGDEGKAS